MQHQSCHFANRRSMKKRNLSTMTSLTYSIKVFMSTHSSVYTNVLHQVSLRSLFYPANHLIYKVKDQILTLKKLSSLMFVMPKMI